MIEHIPSKRLRHMVRRHVKYARTPQRYGQLLDRVTEMAPRHIVEIGVYTGRRSVEMIEAAALRRAASEISYDGFDLFDLMDETILAEELSKQPDDIEVVRQKIESTGATVRLHRGWSHDTVPVAAKAHPGSADIAFIDGGHAVETIQQDWDNIQPMLTNQSVVIFDDYYVDRPDLTDRFGCNMLVDHLDATLWDVRHLPIVDRFEKPDGSFNVALAEVRRRLPSA